MKKVYYIAHYDNADNKEQDRYYILAATNKMDYICQAAAENGFDVEIISASATKSPKNCRGQYRKAGDGVMLRLFYSPGRGNRLKNILGRALIKLQMFFYILTKVRKGDNVAVYHSLLYMRTVSILKKLIGFKLILEVEEIYGDVLKNEKAAKREMRYFRLADSFIFSTELLEEKINTADKPYVVIYGTYKTESDRNTKPDDGKIHLVYAGTFQNEKGCIESVEAAKLLDGGYVLHVAGFGSPDDIRRVEQAVKEYKYENGCQVVYEGLLSGEDYIRFVQSCDIGLAVQSPDAKFNKTSFPSKVLSYLSNGLRVVSVELDAVKRSAVSDFVFTCKNNDAQSVADAVRKAAKSDFADPRVTVDALDREFRKNLTQILS